MDRTVVNQAILDARIYKAVELLRVELVYPSLQPMAAELDGIVDTYWSMIKYLSEGIQDEKQEDVLCYLQRRLLAVSDKVYCEERKRNSGDPYYMTAKLMEAMPSLNEIFLMESTSLPQELPLERRKVYDHLASQLFERVWTTEMLSADLAASIAGASEYLRTLMASAMTLGLVQLWDFEKVRFVLNEMACPSLSRHYRVRLAMALAVAFLIYPKRCELYRKELSALLRKADSVDPIGSVFRPLLKSYLSATETERVAQTIESNLPDLIEASKGKRLEAILSDLEEEYISTATFEQRALEEKMKELGRLEEEGADTLYAAFRNVKQDDFFRSIASWFLPFDPNHSSVRSIIEEHSVLQKVLPLFERRFCDSDLYSLVFGMRGMYMPFNLSDDNAVEMLSQLEEQLKDPLQRSEEILLFEAAKSYIQDLYRFTKLYRGQSKSLDFFGKVVFPDLPILETYLPIEQFNKDVFLFLMGKKRYDEALPFLQALLLKEPTNSTLCLHLATIYTAKGQDSLAVDLYEKADLIEDLDKEARMKLAQAYRKLGRFDQAIKIYESFRENPSVLLSLAATYIETERFEEALSPLYEYDYLSEQSSRAYRPLAWCLFVTGDYARSESYYGRIDTPTSTDFLNMGYCYIAKGELPKALDAFTRALECADSISQLHAEIVGDMSTLLKKGIQPKLINLLFDGAEMCLASPHTPQ